MSLTIDYTAMFEDIVGSGNGVNQSMLEGLNETFNQTRAQLHTALVMGDLPFWDLPFDNQTIDQIVEFAADNKRRFKNFVLLGIGGSALGPIALHSALNHLHHNLLPNDRRNGCRFFCPDNVDPDLVGDLLDVVDPTETLFNVVSKSGSTGETAAQFLIIVDLLRKRLGDNWRNNLVITTDPGRGFLREFCTREDVQSFSIDPNVGGRFSVLTPVGLLPAAMSGIDIRTLCKGAGAVKEACFAERMEDNPAAMIAALLYLSQASLNRPIQVVFAYSNRLYPVSDWFRQLWAESLAKRYSIDGREIFTGPTPVKAIGATDQHSQVQLYVEGPADKVFLFLGPREFRRSVPIPELGMHEDTVDYLQGSELSRLLNAERRATAYALTSAGRPNMTLELDTIDPLHIGALMYLMEAATLYAGGFYNVNPLDQPGVEAGKLATYALMGRPGYEEKRVKIDESPGMGGNVMVIQV